jgi:hypothetical protein
MLTKVVIAYSIKFLEIGGQTCLSNTVPKKNDPNIELLTSYFSIVVLLSLVMAAGALYWIVFYFFGVRLVHKYD